MKHLNYYLTTIAVGLLIILGCSGGGDSSIPSAPDLNEPGLTSGVRQSQAGNHVLLGLWEFIYDFETGEFDIVPLRQAGFHLNLAPVYDIPGNLTVHIINNTLLQDGGLDIDISLVHPIPDSIFMGFDMRGIFFGDGPDTLASKDDPDLMWQGPNGFSLGNADGYTRWWNPTEFTTPGFFGYDPGIYGADFTSASTLNPYKYFATDLGPIDPVIPNINGSNRGSFRTDGGPVTRRFELRFPFDGGLTSLKLQYAFDICWEAPTGGGDIPDPTDFPLNANCPEPFHVEVDPSHSEVYYAGPADYGGSIYIEMEVFDWQAQENLDGIDGEIASITVESDTLFDDVVSVPVDSNPGSTLMSGIYSFAISDVHPTGIEDQEVVICIKSSGGSYQPPVSAEYPEGKPLATYIRVEIPVLGADPEVIGSFGVVGDVIDVATEGNYTYILTSLAALVIVDSSIPSDLTELNTMYLTGTPNALDVQDGYVYVSDGSGNLLVVDVAPPMQAMTVQTLVLLGSPTSVDADGDYAYLTDTDNNMHIVDITVPWEAYVVDVVPISGPGPAEEVVVEGDYAYVADDLEIFDLQIPGNPDSVVVVDTTTAAVEIAVPGTGYVYVANSSNQLLVVDANPPGSAHVAATFPTGAQVTDIQADGYYIFLTLAANQFIIAYFNGEYLQVHLLGSVTTPSQPHSVYVDGNIAYVGCEGIVLAVKLYEVDSPDPEGWAISWGNSTANEVEAIGTVTDSSGNVYVTGLFADTCDFDPGQGSVVETSNGNDDAYLCKFNPNGILLWVRTWGSTGVDQAYDVDIDSSGNVYVTGFYSGTVDFLPGDGSEEYTAVGLYDCFLTKFDSDGNHQWARTWGSGYYDGCNALEVVNNMIFVTGQVSDSTDFDPGPGDYTLHPSSYDAFVCRYESNGTFLWAKIWGSTAYDSGHDISFSTWTERIYITGEFRGTCEFDPDTGSDIHTSAGDADAYLTSYNISGVHGEAIPWGGSEYDTAVGVAVDSTGSIYVTGGYYGTADFDTETGPVQHTSAGEADAYLSIFDSDQVFSQVQVWGGTDNDYCTTVRVDTSDSVYVKGKFHGDVDFDPGPGINTLSEVGTDEDVFLSRFNASGLYLWTQSWPAIHGTGQDNGLCFDNNGNVFIGDASTGTVDFDPGFGNYNLTLVNDAFLIKLLSNGYWYW